MSKLAGVGFWVIAGTMAATIAVAPRPALADQGGVSFWVPGLFRDCQESCV
jgi:hypothetical protein